MIRLTISDAMASIRLDRSEARNALDIQGWRDLAGAVAEVARSEARLLMLGSAVDGAFCAGSDLTDLAALADDPAGRSPFRAMMRDAIDGLASLPIPTLAAIDGDCFGAGFALALGCDIRLAGARARFAVTPAKLGISYPHEDVARLVEAIGKEGAARLLFTAEPIDGAEAARIGLVAEACRSAETRAEEMGRAISGNATESLRILKAMLRGIAKAESDRAFDACFELADFRHRLAAFRNRRGTGSPD